MHTTNCTYHVFPGPGLKKLVNFAIELVLTFFNCSTPRDAAGAFRLTPVTALLLFEMFGACAAMIAAVRLARWSFNLVKLF